MKKKKITFNVLLNFGKCLSIWEYIYNFKKKQEYRASNNKNVIYEDEFQPSL
jgi:hypothetical protein